MPELDTEMAEALAAVRESRQKNELIIVIDRE
jgi:hypothetical protein